MSNSETWKSVVGYEGLYEVSDQGRVRSLTRLVTHGKGDGQRRIKARILRPIVSGNYLQVQLSAEGRVTHKAIHRLVLESFIGLCPDGTEACHQDGDPRNNVSSNLRWDTSKNNHADRVAHGTNTRGERHGSAKLNEDQVLFIKGQLVEGNYSHSEIANWFGVNPATISMISSGKNWGWLSPSA